MRARHGRFAFETRLIDTRAARVANKVFAAPDSSTIINFIESARGGGGGALLAGHDSKIECQAQDETLKSLRAGAYFPVARIFVHSLVRSIAARLSGCLMRESLPGLRVLCPQGPVYCSAPGSLPSVNSAPESFSDVLPFFPHFIDSFHALTSRYKAILSDLLISKTAILRALDIRCSRRL